MATFTFNHNFVFRLYCSYLVQVRNLMIFEDSHENFSFEFCQMDIVVCFVQVTETRFQILSKIHSCPPQLFFLSNLRKPIELYKKT